MFCIFHLKRFSRVNLCNLVVRNNEKKAGEVEKISAYTRNLANFYRKFATPFKMKKQEYYLGKVPKRSREKRTPSFASRIVSPP